MTGGRQNGNGGNGRRTVPTEVPDEVALECFQKFKPPRFSGEKDEETAERWIEFMEDIYETLNYSELKKVSLVDFSWKNQVKLGGEWLMKGGKLKGRPAHGLHS